MKYATQAERIQINQKTNITRTCGINTVLNASHKDYRGKELL